MGNVKAQSSKTQHCLAPVSFRVENDLDRNTPAVQNNINERQRFEADHPINREHASLPEKWRSDNGEQCVSENNNIYCDLDDDFYRNKISSMGEGSNCDGCRLFLTYRLLHM
jgi:hypothetical protein